MKKLNSVAVYCASSNKIRPSYVEAAERLGAEFAKHGIRLIYGDGHESLPNRINKVGNAIDRTAGSDRVYRASAYYMNKTESDVLFNTDAKFVDTYDGKPIHHNLTAINDFNLITNL